MSSLLIYKMLILTVADLGGHRHNEGVTTPQGCGTPLDLPLFDTV